MNNVARAALERALERRDLVLHYQPIHDASTRAIVAAEALLRQQRQSGEIREAAVIAEAAEKSPNATLDPWMLRTAIADASRWNGRASHVRLHVNISARDVVEGDLAGRIGELIARGLDPARFAIEITETVYIAHPERAIGPLRDLRATGIEVWLDDFGTGHSSITHLQHFPLDGIKLPGSFVARVADDHRSACITRALIELAHAIGLRVVAEGVETEEQLAFLVEHQCDSVQGFLFSRPMPAEEVTQAILRSSASVGQ